MQTQYPLLAFVALDGFSCARENPKSRLLRAETSKCLPLGCNFNEVIVNAGIPLRVSTVFMTKSLVAIVSVPALKLPLPSCNEVSRGSSLLDSLTVLVAASPSNAFSKGADILVS